MKLAPFNGLSYDTLPAEVRGWVSRLLTPLSAAVAQASQALSGNLDVEDNLGWQKVAPLRLKAPGELPLSLRLTTPRRPVHVLCTLTPRGGAPTSGVEVGWGTDTPRGGEPVLVLRSVAGFDGTEEVEVRLLILTE